MSGAVCDAVATPLFYAAATAALIFEIYVDAMPLCCRASRQRLSCRAEPPPAVTTLMLPCQRVSPRAGRSGA